MASPPSGRYQSRLFNWLFQGLGQLDKLQPHIRRLKMRATWGVQVAFYWAYGLIQTAWSKGPRLGRAEQPPSATGIPSSSQPIQQILLEVQQSYLSPGSETANNMAASQQDTSASSIQGIATLLTTRTLVLVTEQNQLLDLTLDQQKRLQDRIAQDSSDRQWDRITQAPQRHLRFHTGLGQILSWMPRQLAQPIITRLITRSNRPANNGQFQEPSAVGLVANSQSKIGSGFGEFTRAADGSSQPFGRSSELGFAELSPETSGKTKSNISQALNFLDSLLPRLERQAGRAVHLTRGLLQKPHAALDQKSRDDDLKLQPLIRAAIAYFFDWKPLRFLHHSSTQPVLDSGKPSSISGSQQPLLDLGQPAITATDSNSTKTGQEEPWLTLADLFGGDTSLVSSGSGTASVSMTQAPQRLAKTSNQPPAQSQTLKVAGSSEVVDVEERMDIETEAILMGYIKHPLEQLLGWLDRGLAWLEELVVALWTHLRPYLAALFQLMQQYWRR